MTEWLPHALKHNITLHRNLVDFCITVPAVSKTNDATIVKSIVMFSL